MVPLKVYITRPPAYEIYMGGKRDLRVWLDKPYYSHQSRRDDFHGKVRYTDDGWRAAFCSGRRFKPLYEQDPRLVEVVWPHVFLSVCPQGMSYEQGLAWADTPSPTPEDATDTLYGQLFSDKEWEGKCNTCFKRFLLELDLRTYEVQRIKPGILLRFANRWTYTDEIDAKLAVELFHSPEDIDDIPF